MEITPCQCLESQKKLCVSELTSLEVVSPPPADPCPLPGLVPSASGLWFGPRRRAQKMVLQRLGGGRDLVSPDL